MHSTHKDAQLLFVGFSLKRVHVFVIEHMLPCDPVECKGTSASEICSRHAMLLIKTAILGSLGYSYSSGINGYVFHLKAFLFASLPRRYNYSVCKRFSVARF